ncbi:putative GBF-interacting protein [Helianthus annuus]|nr:putative GBF-interacting protein [Helianthus annuus]
MASRGGGVATNGGAIPSASRKMVQSLKEIVKEVSDAEIYVALKECNMDPNEAVNCLLTQGFRANRYRISILQMYVVLPVGWKVLLSLRPRVHSRRFIAGDLLDANLRESVNHPKCGQFEGIIPDKLWKKYAVKIDVNKYAVKILCSHANTLHDGSNG